MGKGSFLVATLAIALGWQALGQPVHALDPEASRRFQIINKSRTIVQPNVPPTTNSPSHGRSKTAQRAPIAPQPQMTISLRPPIAVQPHPKEPRPEETTQANARANDLESAFASSSSAADRRVTYKTRGNNWFVVSGYKKGQIFYQKTRLAGHSLHSTVLTYPPSERERMNPVVERLNRSF